MHHVSGILNVLFHPACCSAALLSHALTVHYHHVQLANAQVNSIAVCDQPIAAALLKPAVWHVADDLSIDGSVDSLSKVYYTRGKCEIGGVQVGHKPRFADC